MASFPHNPCPGDPDEIIDPQLEVEATPATVDQDLGQFERRLVEQHVERLVQQGQRADATDLEAGQTLGLRVRRHPH
jgi:hypothetical protein